MEDEGLEVSQRLSESLFAGPDLDASTMDVITDSGQRVSQAVGRLMDMLESNIQQVSCLVAGVVVRQAQKLQKKLKKLLF